VENEAIANELLGVMIEIPPDAEDVESIIRTHG
jgi:hypothetical protein